MKAGEVVESTRWVGAQGRFRSGARAAKGTASVASPATAVRPAASAARSREAARPGAAMRKGGACVWCGAPLLGEREGLRVRARRWSNGGARNGGRAADARCARSPPPQKRMN